MRVVVVHGAGGSAAGYADVRSAVEARGHDPVPLDLLGHGEYTGEPFAQPFSWVRSHCDPGDVLWGTSLGAYIALHVAVEEPLVKAVVAVAPTTEAIVRERMDSWGVEIDPGFREQIDASDVFEAAARIACPVLYVHARDDERIPLEVSKRLHAATPHSELIVLESGGHSGPAHDPAVHELTLDWLERVTLEAHQPRGR